MTANHKIKLGDPCHECRQPLTEENLVWSSPGTSMRRWCRRCYNERRNRDAAQHVRRSAARPKPLAVPDDAGPKKRCRRCGQRWPLSAFQASETSPDGLQPVCRGCPQRWAAVGPLAGMSDRALVKRYRRLLRRDDGGLADCREELEIRVQEQGCIAHGGRVYSWDHHRNRLRDLPAAPQHDEERVADPSPPRLYREPAAWRHRTFETNDLGIACR